MMSPFEVRSLRHRPALVAVIALLTSILLFGCQAPAPQAAPPPPAANLPAIPPPDYWPTDGWRSSTPEQQGMDSAQLAALFDAIEQRNLGFHSVLIIRNGYLVTEAYFTPQKGDVKQSIASATKSVTGLLAGILIDQGKIKDASQPVLSFFPEFIAPTLDANKRSMTLQHLLTLTTGLDCSDYAGTRDRMYQSQNWVQFTLDLPVVAAPGKAFSYCSPAVQVMAAVLQRAAGKSERELANELLFAPLGIPPATLAEFPSDPQGVSLGFGGLALLPRDMAKLGYLLLHRGNWDGKQVVPASWIDASLTQRTSEPRTGRGYGYLIWLYKQGYQSMMGLGGQDIHVIPSKNMVVVFTGAQDPDTHDREGPKLLDEFIVPAAKSDKPLPANPAALARPNAAISHAAAPVQPVPPLPALATALSGKVYDMDPNRRGWTTISFGFTPGAAEAVITVDGNLAIPVGLDNVYRTKDFGDLGFTAARGHWEGADTFVVDSSPLGGFLQEQYRMRFGDGLAVDFKELVTGAQYTMAGHPAP